MGRCNLYAMVLVVVFMVVHSEWDWLQPVVRIALPHYTTGTADHYVVELLILVGAFLLCLIIVGLFELNSGKSDGA